MCSNGKRNNGKTGALRTATAMDEANYVMTILTTLQAGLNIDRPLLEKSLGIELPEDRREELDLLIDRQVEAAQELIAFKRSIDERRRNEHIEQLSNSGLGGLLNALLGGSPEDPDLERRRAENPQSSGFGDRRDEDGNPFGKIRSQYSDGVPSC